MSVKDTLHKLFCIVCRILKLSLLRAETSGKCLKDYAVRLCQTFTHLHRRTMRRISNEHYVFSFESHSTYMRICVTPIDDTICCYLAAASYIRNTFRLEEPLSIGCDYNISHTWKRKHNFPACVLSKVPQK